MRNNVKTTIHAIVMLLLLTPPLMAHGGGGFGGFGGFGWGGGGFGGDRGFGGFGGFGDFSLGAFDVERAQTRFEDQLDALQTKYDDGVANTEDFYTSSLYESIVSRTERLDDRYGLFVSGVERSIDRITDIISTTNDDITYFNDLLADYQADTSLSATRLERIEAWITRMTDRLTDRVDSLTEKQTTLQTNLPTYQGFQLDIDAFLADIQAAGGGTTDGTDSSVVSLTSALTMSAVGSSAAACEAANGALGATEAPEPGALSLLLLGLSGGCVLALRKRRR